MREYLRDALFAAALLAVVVLSLITYAEHRKPEVVAPVIEVIEVDDPELATALMVIGQQQVEIQNLIHLHAQYGKLLDLYNERLLEEMRRLVKE